jgi:hypothetical protein
VLPGRILLSDSLTPLPDDVMVTVSDFAARSLVWCVPEAWAAPPVAARPAVAVSNSAVAAAR